jgi:outer membrane biosynthesis protein TonB
VTSVLTRTLVLGLSMASLSLAACQLLNEKPPEEPTKVVLAPSEPAPLPPEETPPPEPAASSAPAPEPKPVEPGIVATGTPTRGTLPKAVIDEKLKSAGTGIQACYERGLKSKPDLHGEVNIDFVVGTDGKVARAAAAEGDNALDDAATVDCILAEIRKLEFPPPKGGRVFINYPLRLEPPKPGAH